MFTVSGPPSSSAQYWDEGYQTQSLQSLVPTIESSKASSSDDKSQRSQSSSLSSKTTTSGDAAAIAIPPTSPGTSPGLSRRRHWADLFSARRQQGQT